MRFLAKANFKARQIAKSYNSSARIGKQRNITQPNTAPSLPSKMSYAPRHSPPQKVY